MLKKVLIILSIVVFSLPILSQQGVAEESGSIHESIQHEPSQHESVQKEENVKEENVRDQFSDNAMKFIWGIDGIFPYIVLTRKNEATEQQGVSSGQMNSAQRLILVTPAQRTPNSDPLSDAVKRLPQRFLPILSIEGNRSRGSWIINGVMYAYLWSNFGDNYLYGSRGDAVLAATGGIALVLIEDFITSTIEASSSAAMVLWPWGYIANRSKSDSAAEEIVKHLDKEPGTTELVVLVKKNLFQRIQKNLLNNSHFSVVREQLVPSRWTTQVIPEEKQ